VSQPERTLPLEGLRPAAAPAAVPRRRLGAPDSAWNPIVSLALAVVAGGVTLAVGLQTGRLDPWLAVPALAICYLAAFTVLHEATHGVAHRKRRINAALGRIGSFVLLLPASLAVLWLAFAFDLLPHHPHTTRERYYDTRIYPGRVLNAQLLGENYHLIHHLWNTIPWYRYERAFRDAEDDLVARGAPIGWHSRAERPRA
jgi:fatty acid desaturase